MPPDFMKMFSQLMSGGLGMQPNAPSANPFQQQQQQQPSSPPMGGWLDQLLNSLQGSASQMSIGRNPDSFSYGDSLGHTTFPAMPSQRSRTSSTMPSNVADLIRMQGLFEPSYQSTVSDKASPSVARNAQGMAAAKTVQSFRPKSYENSQDTEFLQSFVRAFNFLSETSKSKQGDWDSMNQSMGSMNEKYPGSSQALQDMLSSPIFAKHPLNIYKARSKK